MSFTALELSTSRGSPTLTGTGRHTTTPAENERFSGRPQKRSGEGCRSPRLKAFAAEDRTALRGAEGNCRFLAALGAGGPSLYFRIMVSLSWRRNGAEHGDTLRLAGLAPLGFVPELLVVEK